MADAVHRRTEADGVADPAPPTLAYEDVPLRPHVQRFDGGARLVVPNVHALRALAVDQAAFAVMLSVGAGLVAAFVSWSSDIWLLFYFVVGCIVLLALVLGIRAAWCRRVPPRFMVLVWDGEQLAAEDAVIYDKQRSPFTLRNRACWSKAALADVTVRQVWGDCGTVLIESRSGSPSEIGAYSLAPLREAVDEFRAIVFAEQSDD